MPVAPDSLSVKFVLPSIPNARAAFDVIWSALDRDGLQGSLRARLSDPTDVPVTEAELGVRLEREADLPHFSFGFGSELTVGVSRGTIDPNTRSVHATLGVAAGPGQPEAVRRQLGRARRILEQLFVGDQLVRGAIERNGGGATMLPKLPLVSPHLHAIVTTRAAVAEAYSDVASFCAAHWSRVVERAEHLYLERAPEAATAAEYFPDANRSQRALARIVRPGLTQFGSHRVQAEERPLYEEPRVLNNVGYVPEDLTLLLSGVLAPHQHVTGREIDAIASMLRGKQMTDGRPLAKVCVTFLERQVAEREKRPLLEAGAEVRYYDDAGAERQVAP